MSLNVNLRMNFNVVSNLNMWPNSAENYITAAEGFEQIGNHRRACRSLRKARELGYLGEVSFECN